MVFNDDQKQSFYDAAVKAAEAGTSMNSFAKAMKCSDSAVAYRFRVWGYKNPFTVFSTKPTVRKYDMKKKRNLKATKFQEFVPSDTLTVEVVKNGITIKTPVSQLAEVIVVLSKI